MSDGGGEPERIIESTSLTILRSSLIASLARVHESSLHEQLSSARLMRSATLDLTPSHAAMSYGGLANARMFEPKNSLADRASKTQFVPFEVVADVDVFAACCWFNHGR